jgi:hypothetical protein
VGSLKEFSPGLIQRMRLYLIHPARLARQPGFTYIAAATDKGRVKG